MEPAGEHGNNRATKNLQKEEPVIESPAKAVPRSNPSDPPDAESTGAKGAEEIDSADETVK